MFYAGVSARCLNGPPLEIEQTIEATDREDGVRLDRVLFQRFPVLSREAWQERIRAGFVSVDGRSARPSTRVREGAQISFRYEKRPEPPVNRDFFVRHEDEECMVIEKPSNLPVHPSGIYFENTLTALLKERWPDQALHLVHRLDRETSGLLLLAKSGEIAARLQKLFGTTRVRKEYLAVVEGVFPESLDADGFLGPAGGEVKKRMKFSRDDFPGAVGARTEFALVRQVGPLSIVRALLHTGRMHQIRATLCSLGFPVVGDRLYGVDERLYLKFVRGEETEEDRTRLRMDRTALHSHRLEFETTKGRVYVESELPDDIEELILAHETA